MKKEILKETEKTKEPKSQKIVYHFGFYLLATFEDGSKDSYQFTFDDATVFNSGADMKYLIEKTAEKLISKKETEKKTKITSWSFITKDEYFESLFHSKDLKDSKYSEKSKSSKDTKISIELNNKEEDGREHKKVEEKDIKHSDTETYSKKDKSSKEVSASAPKQSAKLKRKRTPRKRKIENDSVENTEKVGNVDDSVLTSVADVTSDDKVSKTSKNSKNSKNVISSKGNNVDLTSSKKKIATKTKKDASSERIARELSEMTEFRKPVESIIPYNDNLLKSAEDIVHPKKKKQDVAEEPNLIKFNKSEKPKKIISPMGESYLTQVKPIVG